MVWKIPRIWEGGTCWIIGGGPSVPREFGVPEEIIKRVIDKEDPLTPSAYSPYMEAIHSCHVIGVNSAFLIGNWIDLVFFGDKRWYLKSRREFANFPGLKVTIRAHFNTPRYHAEGVRYVPNDRNHPRGLTKERNKLTWNQNSGATAINLAYHMGCKRVILLGFDMKKEEGEAHWHSVYKDWPRTAHEKPNRVNRPHTKQPPFTRHKSYFPDIARDAKKMGLEIINASPDSALEVFPKMSVKEILNEEKQTIQEEQLVS